MLLAMQSKVKLNTTRIEQCIAEHKEIIAALQDRNTSAVLAVMEKHINNSGKFWTRYL